MSNIVPGDPLRTIANTADSLVEAVKDRFSGTEDAPLDTVDHVDLTRYAGLWHELARLPILFQKDSTVSTAEYTLRDDGTVGVHNRAYERHALDSDIEGSATPAEGAESTNNRLKVKFGGLASLAPTSDEGNYWILKLADDYSLALVGTPDRDSLWLLARDPSAWDTDDARNYLAWAQEQGFDLDKLIVADWTTRTTHPYRETGDTGDSADESAHSDSD